MTEPTYEYVKGKGWVITKGITKESCMQPWIPLSNLRGISHYKYPPVCKYNYKIIELLKAADLKPGDVLPFSSGSIWVVTGVTSAGIRDTVSQNSLI